jgi:hypothetical protein
VYIVGIPASLADEEILEKDASASRIFEISASSAFTPVEPSHGNNIGQAITGDSRAKSPGPVIAVEKTSTSRSPAFVSTVESSDIHDPMAMSGVDARYGVSISPGILTDNAPLSSQVPVPLSPRLSGRQLRPKSPSRNFEQALAAVNRKARSKRFVMPPVSWSNEKYYLKQILPLFRKHKVVHFNKTDARLANNGLPVELQKLRCRVNYNALKFTPRIEELGRRLVKMLQEKGFFL